MTYDAAMEKVQRIEHNGTLTPEGNLEYKGVLLSRLNDTLICLSGNGEDLYIDTSAKTVKLQDDEETLLDRLFSSVRRYNENLYLYLILKLIDDWDCNEKEKTLLRAYVYGFCEKGKCINVLEQFENWLKDEGNFDF